ncbi:MAG: methyl-accepting chemotaxis protein, partial [Chitinophagaceae bacterium]|nr:methyl-accepting chemotaxis protein [Chitinophagaceae bacterium]
MYSSLPLYRRVIFYLGCTTIAIALVVITGWQFHITTLKTMVPGVTPMNPVTAITFILAGSWIILYTRRYAPYRDAIAAVLSVVGLLHFVTYFLPVPQVRMDYLLYGDVIRNSGIPNKIAPNTALNLLLCGIAMLLTGRGGYKLQMLRQTLLFLSFLLAYTSLLGYVFNLQPAYRFGGLTPMALMTTIAFLFVILALILSDTRYGIIKTFASPLTGGRLMRRIIPMILVFPPLINYLSLIGQQRGWYTIEFGIQLSTFIFAIVLLVFIILYAMVANRQQKKE